MTTPLEKPLRREVWIDSKPYTLTFTQSGMTLTEKRRRRGIDLLWRDLVSGDARLATALRASTGTLAAQPQASNH